jgi:fatty-acyl-CoA synthase
VWGEAVTAVVVLREGKQASAADLIAWVRQAKGPVSTPKAVHFREDIPVTSLGKPDKKALRERYGNGPASVQVRGVEARSLAGFS